MAAQSETLSPALPTDIEELALDVLRKAVAADLKLATAESCTGGLLASLLTDVEGCGHCFERGFVTYSDDSKVQLLGVPRELLECGGAVSRDTAGAMAGGALSQSAAHLAIAITGFAGPGEPGSESGLVYVAVIHRGQPAQVSEYHFKSNSRGEVRIRTLRAALELLIEQLERCGTKA
jgi:nicotinamide-nucleotide amidase